MIEWLFIVSDLPLLREYLCADSLYWCNTIVSMVPECAIGMLACARIGAMYDD